LIGGELIFGGEEILPPYLFEPVDYLLIGELELPGMNAYSSSLDPDCLSFFGFYVS
jgi:hypothetical protein